MLKIPTKAYYRQHLKKYSQYTFSDDWIKWGVHIIPYRAKRTAKILDAYVDPNAKILDLGCAIGLSLHILAQIYPNIIGCDIDKEALSGCKEILKKVGKPGTKLKLYDGVKLPFADNSLDAVLSIEVIEHVENPHQMLKEIKRVLKRDNGVLLITTPNKYWPLETHYKLPFLTFLPGKLADAYVRLSGKGERYDVFPLSYNGFSKIVGKYFHNQDITLDIISRYREFDLQKERGEKVKYAALLVKAFKLFNLEKLLTLASAGWLFVARPKK